MLRPDLVIGERCRIEPLDMKSVFVCTRMAWHGDGARTRDKLCSGTINYSLCSRTLCSGTQLITACVAGHVAGHDFNY